MNDSVWPSSCFVLHPLVYSYLISGQILLFIFPALLSCSVSCAAFIFKLIKKLSEICVLIVLISSWSWLCDFSQCLLYLTANKALKFMLFVLCRVETGDFEPKVLMCFVWEYPMYGLWRIERKRERERTKGWERTVHFDRSEKWHLEKLGEEGKKMEYKIGGNLHAIELKLLNLVEDAASGLVLHHLLNFFLCFLWYLCPHIPALRQTNMATQNFPVSIYSLQCLFIYLLTCDIGQRWHYFFSVIWVSTLVEVKFVVGCICWTECCPFF